MVEYKIDDGIPLNTHIHACEKDKQLSEWMIAEDVEYIDRYGCISSLSRKLEY